SWLADRRMVLVITGKGLRPDGTTGVLRTAVPRWLNESPNRERILGFSYAAPKDGGEGALYVRLKKSSKKRI
ncbi:MAG: Smr/MutS family protein, partial [Rhodospirillales bacterium]